MDEGGGWRGWAVVVESPVKLFLLEVTGSFIVTALSSVHCILADRFPSVEPNEGNQKQSVKEQHHCRYDNQSNQDGVGLAFSHIKVGKLL